jgi:hypothetical protein
MPIDYALAKAEGPKLKAALTRAEKKGYAAVLAACRHAVSRWEVWGAWPDNWSRWQRALDDAAIKHNRTEIYEWPVGMRKQVEAPRLDTL